MKPKLTKAILFCFIIVLSSCEKDLYEKAITANPANPLSFTKLVTFKEVPEVESFIKQTIGDISTSKQELGKSANNLSKIASEVNKIVEVTDTIGNKNYSIRFVYHDTPENVFYNLIVNFTESGKKVAFVEKYICDIAKFEEYKNSNYDFKNFQGKVELYQSNAFFKKSSLTSKSTESPCDQLYYPSEDPIPTRSSFIYTSPQTSAGGGGLNHPSEGSGGWSWSPGFSYSPSTNNDSGSGSLPNNDTGGCCSCGNCGTHFYPPTQADQHTNKIAANPCENLVPIGYIGLWTEPEKVQLVRSSLQISLEQWQWLHGRDYFSDIVLKFLKTAGSGYLLTEYNKIALWAIDYAMTHPPRNNFSIWTMEYLQNNPNVSIEQFQNWFMGTSEGQDGDYDAAFWENPNLTFKKQNLPTYNDYYNGMARFADGKLMTGADNVYGLVGGEVHQARINDPTRTANTCALKVSIALNRAGVIIPSLPGKTLEGSGEFAGKYFFLNARSLNSWMRETFGTNPATTTTPSNKNHRSYTAADGGLNGVDFPDKLKGINAIYSMITTEEYYKQSQTSGHSDLLFTDNNGLGECVYKCFFNLPIQRIDLWILN